MEISKSQRQTTRHSLWDCVGDAEHQVLVSLCPRDLVQLCLVSKKSRASTEPYLYSNISCTWSVKQPCSMLALVQTLLRRPDLAEHVRSVSLLGDDLNKVRSLRDVPEIATAGLDLGLMRKTIEVSKIELANDWTDQLNAGTIDPYVALLLSQLHRLRTLTLERNFVEDTRFFGGVFSSLLPGHENVQLSTFKDLRVISHNMTLYSRSKIITDLLPYFYLPALEQLSLSVVNPAVFEWPAAPPDATLLTSLSLRGIREVHLGRLLSATPNLRQLWWKWYYDEDFENPSNQPIVDLDLIVAALIPIRHSLQDLAIEAQTEVEYLEMPWLKMQGTMKGLIDFNLTRLEVPLAFLATFRPANGVRFQDVVPTHVRTVIITDDLWPHSAFFREQGNIELIEQNEWDDESLFEALKDWIDTWQQSYRHLSNISVPLETLGPDLDREGIPVIADQLRDLCRQYRVAVDIQ
ncbi:hypothetical protein K461DRAFT_44763 [Myriangium duriaei CBS 260.36]|uniref:F-box domain-containing protein n=1 Tax=Myriangium duriaei CBS 260.36 TaxID=1168546 RepID=A0A9P4IV38_9PEZI|nr:hypothetical protein K461DRAFT_44763 [Myriangium duriaei CBS 260.36]